MPTQFPEIFDPEKQEGNSPLPVSWYVAQAVEASIQTPKSGDGWYLALTWKIIECAITVHRALGPGLLESAYLACLIAELRHAGLRVDVGVKVPIVYRGLKLNCGYKLDLLVDGEVRDSLTGTAAQVKWTPKLDPTLIGKHIFFVRLEQSDGNHAWSSPLWVEIKP